MVTCALVTDVAEEWTRSRTSGSLEVTYYFFQAEDGIRDCGLWLEFRRVLFRSGKTEDVWANTQKQYKNGQQLPKTIYLSDIQFGVMKSNKEILYNISGTHDLTLPKKNSTPLIIKGKAIDFQQ
mgnify:CR=1 FL=1